MDTLTPLLAGCVGAGCATELLATSTPGRHGAGGRHPRWTIDRAHSTQPERAVCDIVGLSYRASLKTADAIMVYAERLFEAAKGDMAVLLVIDSLRKSTDVVRSPGFRKLATGKLQRELAGIDKDN